MPDRYRPSVANAQDYVDRPERYACNPRMFACRTNKHRTANEAAIAFYKRNGYEPVRALIIGGFELLSTGLLWTFPRQGTTVTKQTTSGLTKMKTMIIGSCPESSGSFHMYPPFVLPSGLRNVIAALLL